MLGIRPQEGTCLARHAHAHNGCPTIAPSRTARRTSPGSSRHALAASWRPPSQAVGRLEDILDNEGVDYNAYYRTGKIVYLDRAEVNDLAKYTQERAVWKNRHMTMLEAAKALIVLLDELVDKFQEVHQLRRKQARSAERAAIGLPEVRYTIAPPMIGERPPLFPGGADSLPSNGAGSSSASAK